MKPIRLLEAQMQSACVRHGLKFEAQNTYLTPREAMDNSMLLPFLAILVMPKLHVFGYSGAKSLMHLEEADGLGYIDMRLVLDSAREDPHAFTILVNVFEAELKSLKFHFMSADNPNDTIIQVLDLCKLVDSEMEKMEALNEK